MRWLTEISKGHVLDPNDQITNGQDTTVNVIKALQLKHPAPVLPHSSTLLEPDHLPELEDLLLQAAIYTRLPFRSREVQDQGTVTLPTGKTSSYDMVPPVDVFATVLLS